MQTRNSGTRANLATEAARQRVVPASEAGGQWSQEASSRPRKSRRLKARKTPTGRK